MLRVLLELVAIIKTLQNGTSSMATFLSTPAQPTYQTKTAKTAHVAAFITTKPTFLPLKTWPTLTAKERLRQQLHLLSYQSGLVSLQFTLDSNNRR